MTSIEIKKDNFIQKANLKHNGIYDYSKVEYIKSCMNIIIICKKHGEFVQRASHHLSGSGCSRCSIERQAKEFTYSQEGYIKKVQLVHYNAYDYSKVKYVNLEQNIIIICKKHGEFEQPAVSHLIGVGCRMCSKESYSEKKRDTTETFIAKAYKVHGDVYDYSKVEYIESSLKVTIVCKKHGEFQQTPNGHLMGHGCSKCGTESNVKKITYTQSEFIEKAKKVHDNVYDYSKVEYTGYGKKIVVICNIHGEFNIIPTAHICGRGCQKCSFEKQHNHCRSNVEEFIEKSQKVHKEIYDYSKVRYINNETNVIITCRKHGDFLQTPASHLRGYGCQKCGIEKVTDSKRSNNEKFIKKSRKIHGNIYNYSKVEYVNNLTNVIIICGKHGEFLRTPAAHLHGSGCSMCTRKTEGKLYNRIIEIYPTTVSQFKQDWCKNKKCLPFDFCIPDKKIIIELDGFQHFRQVLNWRSPEEQFEIDKLKEKCANENGYSTIRLLQDDVYYDKYDWLGELRNNIETITNEGVVVNKYMCKKDEYKCYLVERENDTEPAPEPVLSIDDITFT